MKKRAQWILLLLGLAVLCLLLKQVGMLPQTEEIGQSNEESVEGGAMVVLTIETESSEGEAADMDSIFNEVPEETADPYAVYTQEAVLEPDRFTDEALVEETLPETGNDEETADVILPDSVEQESLNIGSGISECEGFGDNRDTETTEVKQRNDWTEGKKELNEKTDGTNPEKPADSAIKSEEPIAPECSDTPDYIETEQPEKEESSVLLEEPEVQQEQEEQTEPAESTEQETTEMETERETEKEQDSLPAETPKRRSGQREKELPLDVF